MILIQLRKTIPLFQNLGTVLVVEKDDQKL